MDNKIIKRIVDAGFKQYLKKLRGTYKKTDLRITEWEKRILYNAYNNGFTAGIIFIERTIKEIKEKKR